MQHQDINFFSTFKTQSSEKQSQNRYGYALLGVLAVFIIGTFVMTQFRINGVKNKIADLTTQLEAPELQAKIKESDIAFKTLEVLEQYNAGITSLTSSIQTRDIITTQKLDLISSTLPSEVTFGSLNITNSTITMSATATTREAIAEVQHNLKVLDFIADVYIGAISGTDVYSFSLNCVVKDVR